MRPALAAALICAAPGHGGAQDAGVGPAIDAAALSAASDGGVRRWRVAPDGELTLRGSPSDGAPAVAALPEGALLSNQGCAEAADQLWCAVRPVGGGARGYALASRLRPAAWPEGAPPIRGVNDSRKRARKGDFDATGAIACAQEQGQSLGTCDMAVARSGGGDATLVVTFSNGFKRQLYFVHGAFMSASATMSGAGRDTEWRLENGTYFVRVDDQRYEASKALIFGE